MDEICEDCGAVINYCAICGEDVCPVCNGKKGWKEYIPRLCRDCEKREDEGIEEDDD